MADSNDDNEEVFNVFEDKDMFDKIRQYTGAIRLTDKRLLIVGSGVRSRFESLDAMTIQYHLLQFFVIRCLSHGI